MEPSARKKHYLLHRWVGLVVALIGLLVFFSGAVATFHQEIDGWATRGHRYPHFQDVEDFSLDEAMALAARDVPEARLEQVDIRQTEGRPLFLFLHEHDDSEGSIREVGVATRIDPTDRSVVSRIEGDRAAVFVDDPIHSLSRFFIDLHIFLLMPRTLGLTVVGLTGFALLVLICTGTLVHRPTWSTLGRVPRSMGRKGMGELHTLVGLWTLPYTAILAMTGTFFAFAGTVLIPVVAMVAFGGDQEALVRTAIGEIEVAPSDQVASLDPIVADAVARSEGAVIQSIGLDRWRTDDANATVRLVRETPLGSTNLNYIYDGHTGDFLYDKPGIGTVPSVGSAAVDLMGKLHFGTLFGIVTKLLWGGFGLATCLIAVAGLAIYVLRQREETRATQFVRTMTVVASAGIPMASAATALAWVVSLSTGVVDPEPVLTATFLGVIATSAGLALVRPFTAALGDGWAASGLALIGLVVAAPLATGLGWAEVWADVELRETLWVDGALLVAALSLGAMSFAIRRARPQDAREQVVPTPAGAEEDAVLSGAGLT